MYNEILNVSTDFQNSINLNYDLNNIKKIKNYIPTSDICFILKFYLNSALGKEKNHATTLVGPYGKGKSFLILVYVYVLSGDFDSRTYSDLANKIKNVDEELYNLLIEIKTKKIKFLPVIVSGNYNDLNQAFTISINKALLNNGLDDIVPETVYDICLDLISKWNSDKNFNIRMFNECLKEKKINLKSLIKGLKSHSKESYLIFTNLYNCVIIGQKFNPLISNDVASIYEEVEYKISNKGYNGMLVLFDEFSKFLESESNSKSLDMKLIQDLAELANRSSKKHILEFICITHKSLNLYSNSNEENNKFKTVEGRFKEVRFNRSLNENYQIIASTINKNAEFNSFYNRFRLKNESFYNDLSGKILFQEKYIEKWLYKGCFPLNPFTSFAIIKISEILAQNERTLFTFLADKKGDSLYNFVNTHDENLFNIYHIYNYFSTLMSTEETNDIRETWYKCEGAIDRLSIQDGYEIKLLKTIAVLKMLKDNRVIVDASTISLAMFEEKTKIINTIQKLVDQQILKVSIINNEVDFTNANIKEMRKLLELEKSNIKNKFDIYKTLTNVNESKYSIPRKYNELYKMTRFYKRIFINANDLLKLKSFNLLFKNNFCDGFIIYIACDKDLKKELCSHIDKIGDGRIVLIFSEKIIKDEIYDYLLEYEILKKIKNRDDININIKTQINLLIQEYDSNINSFINANFIKSKDFYNCKIESSLKKQEFISGIFEIVYDETPVINFELVNKEKVSSNYTKARNNVINNILNGEDNSAFGITSQEGSIIGNIINHKTDYKFNNVIELVYNFLHSAEDEKKSFEDIIKILKLAPYGIRNGILPIILVLAIEQTQDNIVIYKNEKEIDMNAANLSKVVDYPSEYFVKMYCGVEEQNNYIRGLIYHYSKEPTNNFRKDIKLAAKLITDWGLGLPNIIRYCNQKNNYLNLNDKMIKLKQLCLKIDINSYDFIMNKIPEALNCSTNYKECLQVISSIEILVEPAIKKFKQKLILSTKEIFMKYSSTSIKGSFENWKNTLDKDIKNYILSEKNKKILKVFENQNYNDEKIIEMLAFQITKNNINDWDSDHSDEVIKELNEFIKLFEDFEEDDIVNKASLNLEDFEIHELTSMGKSLSKSVNKMFDSFSSSTSNKEKISILAELLKKYI